MGAPRPESIVLFGGPNDGALVEVDPHPPLDYRIPIPLSMSKWLTEGPNAATRPEISVGIYAPRCDKFGKVQCDLVGHPIYEWRGER